MTSKLSPSDCLHLADQYDKISASNRLSEAAAGELSGKAPSAGKELKRLQRHLEEIQGSESEKQIVMFACGGTGTRPCEVLAVEPNVPPCISLLAFTGKKPAIVRKKSLDPDTEETTVGQAGVFSITVKKKA